MFEVLYLVLVGSDEGILSHEGVIVAVAVASELVLEVEDLGALGFYLHFPAPHLFLHDLHLHPQPLHLQPQITPHCLQTTNLNILLIQLIMQHSILLNQLLCLFRQQPLVLYLVVMKVFRFVSKYCHLCVVLQDHLL